MRLQKCLMISPMLCASLLAVSGCGDKEPLRAGFPPSADLKAVVTPKPLAGPEILESAQAAAAFDIALEKWGDTLFAAGGRICRWMMEQGARLDFCPPDSAVNSVPSK